MSPAAIYAPPVLSTDSQKVVAAVPVKGPALCIGSPATATDGRYQTLVTRLEETRNVDKQMLDRLLDGGMLTNHRTLSMNSFLLCYS